MPRETFEQFMSRALHDPESGYYARRIRSVGHRGDFTTAPMISDSPARAIARWAMKAMRDTGCRDLVEIGPGEGTLAEAVLRHLPPLQRWRTRLHLVETSAPLAERQKHLLGKRAVWHHDIRDALATCKGRAVIYSNELVDAYPVRRFQKTPEGWQELVVDTEGQITSESLLPPAPLPDSSIFQEAFKSDQRVEVHDSYRQHLTDWLPHWKYGRLLTIDYGAEAATLYHRRPAGSLRAYLYQQRIEGPGVYQNPGRQDITADVNFTDLQKWTEPWVSEQRLMSFRNFLRDFGGNPAPFLSAVGGAGEAFLVLDQKCMKRP